MPKQEELKSACQEKFGVGAWMKMNEMKDGMITGPVCWGCMVDDKTQVCKIEEIK